MSPLSSVPRYLSNPGSCKRGIFSPEESTFCHEVFFRMYLPRSGFGSVIQTVHG